MSNKSEQRPPLLEMSLLDSAFPGLALKLSDSLPRSAFGILLSLCFESGCP